MELGDYVLQTEHTFQFLFSVILGMNYVGLQAQVGG